jgi:hypothetical protein
MATIARAPGLRPPVVWRPLEATDLAYVAALEQQIHAAPWTLGNFRDALAAGYCAMVGEREGRIVAFGVLMLALASAGAQPSVPPRAARGLGRALLTLIDVMRGASEALPPRVPRRASGSTRRRASRRWLGARITIRRRRRRRARMRWC